MSTAAPMPDQSQGWSTDDYKLFGIESPPEPPKEEAPRKGLTEEELAALEERHRRDQAHQAAMLQQTLEFQARSMALQQQGQQGQQSQQDTSLPEKLPVKFDAEGKPYVETKDVLNTSKVVVDQYHKDVIEPVAPVVDNVSRQQKINDTINWIKTVDPKLLEGRDPNEVAGLAMGLYYSDANPGGNDDNARTNYVVQHLKALATPGNPTIKSVQAANQVGRTSGGNMPSMPYPPGAKIYVNRKPAYEVGLDAFSQQAAREEELRQLNAQHNMGWTFIDREGQ